MNGVKVISAAMITHTHTNEIDSIITHTHTWDWFSFNLMNIIENDEVMKWIKEKLERKERRVLVAIIHSLVMKNKDYN
jgi:hypothetical protein